MSYIPFEPVVYFGRVYGSVRFPPICNGTGTNNPSLSAIPTAQKQSFAGIATRLLVMCVIQCVGILVTSVSAIARLGLQGHHSSCELSTNYGVLVDLIESFESFLSLQRLDIYTIKSTTQRLPQRF